MIPKPTETTYPIHPLIRDRWSPLAFDPRPVEPAKLGSLLEAARWAASCYNEQPWFFLVATADQPAEFERMFSCIVEGNQSWAKAAPVLMLGVASRTFARNGNENRHGYHDLGAAIANLAIQATALDLITHAMGGFDPDRARALYQIPSGYDPVTAIAVGYQGELRQLPTEQLQQREAAPRSRKPLTDFVFTGQWNQTAPWLARS
ncbi:nitroreductase family protein [Spirulina major CS-329]|uniref:nitroreductase family protein n=1 Tax=Spirulina TaxID=1154 RepID=UPI00232F21B2|nr:MULTISPECIES: nitroreductase family protein [Spirulina]MDB9496535.1 nitroreductase family protein [Spirulina subsalsa CS-330]MDB9505078.1 nitroreductase family protein [Spirulina major CS-329]